MNNSYANTYVRKTSLELRNTIYALLFTTIVPWENNRQKLATRGRYGSY